MGQVLVPEKDQKKKNQLGSKALVQAIEYWNECSGKSKFDLAKESGLWKVQVNPDGWERTQTLDKYLDYKTFPANPRWNRVLNTIDFVLMHSKQPSNLRKELETDLQKLLKLL